NGAGVAQTRNGRFPNDILSLRNVPGRGGELPVRNPGGARPAERGPILLRADGYGWLFLRDNGPPFFQLLGSLTFERQASRFVFEDEAHRALAWARKGNRGGGGRDDKGGGRGGGRGRDRGAAVLEVKLPLLDDQNEFARLIFVSPGKRLQLLGA